MRPVDIEKPEHHRLAVLQLGHRVTLLERAPPPRPHVGESLTPGIANIVALLGVGAEVAPLLDVLRATPWLRSAMATWSATMPPANAARIAGWLYAHRLVREA